jgi:hypothetical protein
MLQPCEWVISNDSLDLFQIYYIILIKLTPHCDHDMLDKILVSSPCLEGCDKAEILSDVAISLAIFPILRVQFLDTASQQSKY